MPLRIRKLPRQRKYRVYDGKRVIAKSTSKSNAEKQVRLIRGVKHGMISSKRG
jgi:hypothetical protein